MTSKGPDQVEDEEEDDYMNMTIIDQAPAKRETQLERIKRKKREAEERSRVKSKKELAAEEEASREAGLSTTLDKSNKGFKMLATMGYKPGQALGKTDDAKIEPIGLEVKEGRGGIGLDSEKKRKFREEVQAADKKQKVDQEDYRERLAREREEKRNEGMMFGAMKIGEAMDAEDTADKEAPKLSSVNILWRSLVRDRLLKEREKRMRADLLQSLSRNTNYDDSDEQDAIAYGETEVELEEEDKELEEFEQLDPAVRLERLTLYLRERWNYCFWCKFKYEDESMEGCPGKTEEDHD